MADLIVCELSAPVATIRLNRPKRGNAMTPDMGEQLVSVLNRLKSDPTVRVVIITGSGKYFCTGMDLGASNQARMQQNLKGDGDTPSETNNIFEAVKSFPKPTIAAINGPVYGGGNGLVFVCDIRIAVRSAFFCFSEVQRGISPALISAYIVPQMGPFLSNQYMLTGEKITAQRLFDMGCLSKVVDEDQLDNNVEFFATTLLKGASGAMHTIKGMTRYVSQHTHEENMDYVQRVFREMMTSEEARYGISSFMQKKTPDWTEHYQLNSRL